MIKRVYFIGPVFLLLLLISSFSFASAQQTYTTNTCSFKYCTSGCTSKCCDARCAVCTLGTAGLTTNQSNSTYSGSCSTSQNFCDSNDYGFSGSGSCTAINNITTAVPITTTTAATVGTDQTILLLSNSTNAHGALWNDTNYLVKIQYNTIFGTNYTEANPHACTGSNTVLKLSSNTNAHAAGPTDTNYNTNVCYGNLVCTLRSGSCQGTEKLIVSLSSTTNAHLAADNSSTNSICCTSGIMGCAAGTLLCANGLCSSDKTCAGNGGLPSTNNNGICEAGESCNAQDCAFRQDSCQSGLICFSGWCQPSVCPAGTTRCNEGTCQTSPSCPNNGGPYVNRAPIVNITNPLTRQIYYVGNTVNFNSVVTDEGPVTLQWNISDSTGSSLNSFSSIYTTPGIKVITLRATDAQGLVTEAQTAILVLGSTSGNGIFPYINKPFHKQSIVDSALSADYSGEESYAVRSDITGSPCTATVTCLAGKCPANTAASPTCASNPAAPISIPATSVNYNSLLYGWTFIDGASSTNFAGLARTSGRYGYADSGNKIINLLLNYNSSGVNIQDRFTREFTLYGTSQCIAGGNIFVEIDAQGREISRQGTTNSIACAGRDQIAGNADDCCASGFSCSTDPVSPGCKLTGNVTQLVQCSGYTNQTTCENDALKVSPNSPLYNLYGCGTTVNANNTLCSCSWDFPTNSCQFGKTIRSSLEPTTILSECIYDSILGECQAGYQTVDITAKLLKGNDPTCVNSQQTIPCQRSLIQLPFFGLTQFVLTITAISLLYVIMFRSRNQKDD